MRARANVRLGLGISTLSLSLGPRPSLGLAQALKPKPLSLLGEICAKTMKGSRRWPAMQASWFRRRARPRARHARTARAVTAWRRRTTAGVHSRCRHTGAALVEHQERRNGNPEPVESLPEYMVKGRALGNCVKVDHSESKTLTCLSPAANKVVRVAFGTRLLPLGGDLSG